LCLIALQYGARMFNQVINSATGNSSVLHNKCGVVPAKMRKSVVILCPEIWGVRNTVHSGLLSRIEEAGVRAHILIGGTLSPPRLPNGELFSSWSAMLNAHAVRAIRGKTTLDELRRASFCRRHGISGHNIRNQCLRQHNTPWETVRNATLEAL